MTHEQWGDSQQFEAEEMPSNEPKVHLLWMTPDPLGALAAFSSMYSGRVVRDLGELTHEDRMQAWADVQKTHLRAPMEAVKMHFLLEGVDRAFTHQLVRQRTAVYAQESQRFAVVGELKDATSLPPSLEGTQHMSPPGGGWDSRGLPNEQAQRWRNEWDRAINVIDGVYHYLVSDGMPAEEARGLLPNCTLTRVHYSTDLRNLLEHAGNRLCTQAQFHWRAVFGQIREAIRNYDPGYALDWSDTGGTMEHTHDGRQFAAIAEAFKPICYQLGECPFQASFDRECKIRDRVNFFSQSGISSEYWHDQGPNTIRDEEWALDPGAARR